MGHISTNFAGLPLTNVDRASNASNIRTNRDFYIAIACLRTIHRGKRRDLETYLCALLGVARRYRNEAHISLGDFAEMLREALVVPAVEAVALVAKTGDAIGSNGVAADPYIHWEQTILQQIAHLREMRKVGKLNAPHEIKPSPRREIWRHTSVPEYLECAAAGTFGGWDIGDETDIQEVDWPTAQAFLNAGQSYE